jgi:hypothetical protein
VRRIESSDILFDEGHMDKKLFYIIVVGLILRLAVILIVDLRSDFYWEYGEIAKNIVAGKGYSFFYINDGVMGFMNTPSSNPQSSAYMPPFYVLFLTPFMLIKSVVLKTILLLAVQAVLGSFVIWLMAKYVKQKFSSSTVAYIAALIITISPEFLYSVKSYTPTILFQVFLLLFLLIRGGYFKIDKRIIIALQGVLVVAMIYCRSEFSLVAVILAIFFLVKRQYKSAFVFTMTMLLLTLPWTIRNYQVFHKFIPLTTNGGFNLYRGNNAVQLNTWRDSDFEQEVLLLAKNMPFEIAENQVYQKKAIEFAEGNPTKTIGNIFRKIFDLWVINLDDDRGQVISIAAINLIFLMLFLIGFVKSFSYKKYKFEYFYFIYSTLIAAAFFVLPRYQTMLHTLMIPFCAYGTQQVLSRLKLLKAVETA